MNYKKKEFVKLVANTDFLFSLYQEDFDDLKSEILNILEDKELTELTETLSLILEGDEKIKPFILNFKENNNITFDVNGKGKYLFYYVPKGIKLPLSVKFNPFEKKATLKIEFNYLFNN